MCSSRCSLISFVPVCVCVCVCECVSVWVCVCVCFPGVWWTISDASAKRCGTPRRTNFLGRFSSAKRRFLGGSISFFLMLRPCSESFTCSTKKKGMKTVTHTHTHTHIKQIGEGFLVITDRRLRNPQNESSMRKKKQFEFRGNNQSERKSSAKKRKQLSTKKNHHYRWLFQENGKKRKSAKNEENQWLDFEGGVLKRVKSISGGRKGTKVIGRNTPTKKNSLFLPSNKKEKEQASLRNTRKWPQRIAEGLHCQSTESIPIRSTGSN